VKTCPAATRWRAAAFSDSRSLLVVHRAEMLNAREPGGEARTTWTAVAPAAVFTVRTHAAGQLFGPSLVRKFAYEN
jgi:hypothetical protein